VITARPAVSRLARCSLGALVSALAVSFAPAEARADVSTWLSIGGGVARLEWAGRKQHEAVLLPTDIGMGLPPQLPVVAGIGLRLTPYFGDGFDYAAYARLATGSYVNGKWGVAIDGGGYTRAFAGGNSGFLGTLNLGAPWGIVVALTYERGADEARTMSGVLAIDFLRLTVYRLSGDRWWPNVNPAHRPPSPTEER
jgi:hypothetical protein